MGRWLGGAHGIAIVGHDDVDGSTSPHTIRGDDLITHGVYGRLAVMLDAGD